MATRSSNGLQGVCPRAPRASHTPRVLRIPRAACAPRPPHTPRVPRAPRPIGEVDAA